MGVRRRGLIGLHGSDRSGSALLQVLGAVAILSAAFYALSTYVIQQRTQILRNNSIVQARLALQSTVDYAIYGIRQKWCFQATIQQDSRCDLNHDGNVERVVMSVEQENFIKELIASGVLPAVSGPISLNAIDRYVDLSSITSSHPLFVITNRLKKEDKMGGIQLRIERDDSPKLPRSGREVYLRVKAYFTDQAGGAPKKDRGHELSVTSYLSVHPREIGSFALLVPKDLRMDKAYSSILDEGDVTFHQFAGIGAVNGPGLKFLSPVFVNHNFYLPAVDAAADRESPDKVYTPVTFADTVILGNGGVYENNKLYVPASAGGSNDRMWSDNRLFGGLQKGLENDGSADLGLDYFAHHGSDVAVDPALMAKCIDRNLKKSTYEAIKNSVSYSVRTESSSSGTYRLWLSEGNSFSPQTNALGALDLSTWPGATFNRTGPAKNAVVGVRVEVGSSSVTVPLPIGGSVEVKPPIVSISPAQAQADVNEKSDRQNQTQKSVDDLTKKQSESKKQLAEKQQALSDEKSKASPDQNVISQLNGDIAALNSQIASTDGALSKAKTDNDEALAALSKANQALQNANQVAANPPSFRLSATGVTSAGDTQPNKIDVALDVVNPTSLQDASASQINRISVMLTALDGTFYQGISSLSEPDKSTHLRQMTTFMEASFDSSARNFQWPSSGSATKGGAPVVKAEDMTNYGAIDRQCAETSAASGGAAFGSAPWDYSFKANTRSSWNFAGTTASKAGQDPLIDTLTFDINNSNTGRLPIVFQVRSIAHKCVIKSTANFVTGFFGCDTLIIEPRTEPLRLIATVIAAKTVIDPSAYKAGITWSSIYHPQAVYELRRTRTLRTLAGAACPETASSTPIWHPIPSVVDVSNRFSCNVISLRAKADPFQWTSVDPDCGLLPGKSSTSCKKRVTRFLVVEHSRETGL